jgi:predicted nucleic acid-binding protein
MPASVLVDSGFLVALLNRRDGRHDWAVAQAERHRLPWRTCEGVLTEAFYLLGSDGTAGLIALVRRDQVLVSFTLNDNQEPVFRLMQKYSNVPMSFADACLVRMSETHADPIILTTDADFQIYRRHSRQVVPCVLPG